MFFSHLDYNTGVDPLVIIIRQRHRGVMGVRPKSCILLPGKNL